MLAPAKLCASACPNLSAMLLSPRSSATTPQPNAASRSSSSTSQTMSMLQTTNSSCTSPLALITFFGLLFTQRLGYLKSVLYRLRLILGLARVDDSLVSLHTLPFGFFAFALRQLVRHGRLGITDAIPVVEVQCAARSTLLYASYLDLLATFFMARSFGHCMRGCTRAVWVRDEKWFVQYCDSFLRMRAVKVFFFQILILT